MQPSKHNEISPSEIKGIRKSLGLSQTEAGERLGGGPSAFAKYENGSVKPSAALVKMLRFLQKRPEELDVISGEEDKGTKSGPMPFDLKSEHVSALGPRDFSALVEKLLVAEALERNLPLDGIHVASEQNVTDGGEDARIEWRGGPERTGFLPGRFCQFQLKTGDVSPKEAGDEVLTRENKLKPMVQEALERGASYIMLCSKPYTRKLIDKREDSIKENLENQGFKDPSVQFRDSGQIAFWVNYHPCVAIWLLQKTRPELIDPSFGDWKHWSGRPEHCNSPWVDDPRLPDFREKLRAIVETPKGVARVIGPYGSGKSRLTLEALAPTEKEKTSGVKLSELLLYTVESETSSQKIKKYTKNLANSGKRVMLVVDRCLEQTRIDLVNMAKHSDSCLSLVTISGEVPRDAEESENTLIVDLAGSSLIQKIVEMVDPSIPEWEVQRIIDFSKGDISCAQIIGKSWQQKGLTATEDEDFLIRKFLGNDNQEHIYETAMLISTFDGVKVEAEPVYNEKSELEQVAEFSGAISVENFRGAVGKLKRRGVLRQQGDRVILEPKHIAIRLAQQQWEEWSPTQWEGVLVGSLPEKLRVRTARQLAFLNTKPIATEVTKHILVNRRFGHSPEKQETDLAILIWLAEIDSRSVVNVLENMLRPFTRAEVENITGTTRRYLVRTLTKLAFVDNSFEDAAVLLFKLACGENENFVNNATGQFKSLFPVRLATTEAGSEKRFEIIDEFMDKYWNNSSPCLSIIVDALLEGAKTHHFHRDMGPEIHGSRPALESWLPRTYKEYWDYIRGCVNRLVRLAKRSDKTGQRARAGLGQKWHKYVLDGLIEDVERWTYEIKEKHSYWPKALASLERLLEYDADKLEPAIEKRVETLISDLTPDSLDNRIRFLITEMPFEHLRRKDIDLDEMFKLQREEIKKLVGELFGQKTELTKLLPRLCVGQHRNARLFGYFLAEQVQDPLHWKNQIMDAFESIPVGERNSDFLVGYMAGLKEWSPGEFEKFKQKAIKSPVFAAVLPELTSRTGISPEDVGMIIGMLENNLISHREMIAWKYGSALSELQPSEVSPLFDLMLRSEDPPSFATAVDLMSSYSYRQQERLENLRPQLLFIADYSPTKRLWAFSAFQTHTYETLMSWIISKGITDADARQVAITLVKQLIRENLEYDDEKMIGQLLPTLLSNFAEIVWPMISKAIEENNTASCRLSMMLREKPPFGDSENPTILSLPENILFGWCCANPQIGPAFVAGIFPLLKECDQETGSEEFHPVIKRLLDEFGESEDVLGALAANIHSFSGWGSETDHLARYREPLRSIENQHKGSVKRWARKMLRKIDDEIETLKV